MRYLAIITFVRMVFTLVVLAKHFVGVSTRNSIILLFEKCCLLYDFGNVFRTKRRPTESYFFVLRASLVDHNVRVGFTL